MQEWMSFIRDVGFPIVVTMILLYRIEAKLDVVVKAIESLPHQLKQ